MTPNILIESKALARRQNEEGEIARNSAVEIGNAVRSEFYESVAEVLRKARVKSYRAVNFIMVEAYWNVGRMIIEEEQHGKERAEYGKALIRTLSERLIAEFGAGFGASNLAYFRQFYLSFPIFHAVRGKSEDTKTAEDQVAN
jgi:hypothetical protein